MAGIKRFITYIYAYENGTKGINAGFAKVEIRGNECRIEVHLRGTPIRMGMDQVYLRLFGRDSIRHNLQGRADACVPDGRDENDKRKRRLWNNYKGRSD